MPSRRTPRTLLLARLALAALFAAGGAAELLADVETRGLYIFDDFPVYPWSGFWGTANGASITVDHCDTNAYDGVYSTRFETTGAEEWCGVHVQVGSEPGLDFTGAGSVVYALRGQTGGEQVELRFMDEAYTQAVTLASEWQCRTNQFQLTNDWSSVRDLLTIVVTGWQAGTFYVDEVRLLVERPGGAETPAFPPVVRGLGYNAYDPANHSNDFAVIRSGLGANCLRFWGQTDLTHATLDAAMEHELRVLLPFWMPLGTGTDYPGRYTDGTWCAAVRRSVSNYLAFHLPHPAVPGVCLGNEVVNTLANDTAKHAFAALLESICQDIHNRYPGLDVMYAAAWTNAVPFLQANAPSLDYYGCNVYGHPENFINDYTNAGYGKPLFFCEYGCYGWWETDWTNYSHEARAADYTNHWETVRNNSIGGCAFLWLDKQDPEGHFGWGIIESNRTVRPQYEAIADSYARAYRPYFRGVTRTNNDVLLALDDLQRDQTCTVYACAALPGDTNWTTNVSFVVAAESTNLLRSTGPGPTNVFFKTRVTRPE
ncbi:MAG: hypothetical protein JXR37_34690 [Kiritimatiellae bacterium]|nr:hypothetical protein [Kiritimatiellia bacterium]